MTYFLWFAVVVPYGIYILYLLTRFPTVASFKEYLVKQGNAIKLGWYSYVEFVDVYTKQLHEAVLTARRR